MAEKKTFGPCSEKQRLVLQDKTTDVILVGGGAGGGKAIQHGEKVLTPKGFVNIEEIRVGDEVVTPDNKIERVLNVWPQGIVDIYRVTMQDGVGVNVCGNHLWEYFLAGKKSRGTKVRSTLEIKKKVDYENSKKIGARRFKPCLRLISPVSLPKHPEPLHIAPYTLGVILGDGHISGSGARITSMDQEILNGILQDGYELSAPRGKGISQASDYTIYGLKDKLTRLNLLNTRSNSKFIPEQYKYASIEDRFSIVQGLMDTDGYVDSTGSTYYSTVSKQLCDDMVFILRGLGFTCTIQLKPAGYKSIKTGEYIECQPCYELYIRGQNQEKLFRLSRKLARCKYKEVSYRIDNIDFVGRDYATCIEISGSQKLFITSHFIVTHNSATCLMKNLDGINDPHFRCTIFRRTNPELQRQGGLIDESKNIYNHFGAIYGSQSKTWNFPAGAKISFSAIGSDRDLGGWQGSQLVRVLIDEVADGWTEHQVLFLLSRLRSAHSKIHPQMILTCNPDRNSFLYNWVEWCLDKETGVPLEGTENIVKWFVVINNTVLWGDSPEECYEKHGEPRGLIYGRGLSDEEIMKIPPDLLCLPKSFRFVPTNVYDNKYLLPPKNNSYLASLLAQPKVNQLKFLHGSWTAKAEGDSYFERGWCAVVDLPPLPHEKTQVVRAWDFAATTPSETNRDPDWTAGVKMSRDKMGVYYIEDVYRFRKLTDGVIKEVIKTAYDDGLDVQVTIPRDSGSGGKSSNFFYVRTLAENGIAAKSIQISGHKGKLQRFLPFTALAKAGWVRVVKGDWNNEFFDELEAFSGNNKGHDDMVDACADAFNTIAQGLQIPTFAMPNMSKPSIVSQMR